MSEQFKNKLRQSSFLASPHLFPKSTKDNKMTLAEAHSLAITKKRNKSVATPMQPLLSPLAPENIYRTGDGDIVQARRPGSQDFLKYPSLITGGHAEYRHSGHK